jgi:hypothetical protein
MGRTAILAGNDASRRECGFPPGEEKDISASPPFSGTLFARVPRRQPEHFPFHRHSGDSQQALRKQNLSHVVVDTRSRIAKGTLTKHRHNPESFLRQRKQVTKCLSENTFTPAPANRAALPFAHGDAHAGYSVGGIHKEQPHQPSLDLSAGAEDEVELPSASQAKRSGKGKRHALY